MRLRKNTSELIQGLQELVIRMITQVVAHDLKESATGHTVGTDLDPCAEPAVADNKKAKIKQ